MSNLGPPANKAFVSAPPDAASSNSSRDVSRSATGRWLARFQQLPPPIRAYALPLVATALVGVGVAILEPNFYRPENLHVLMQQYAVLGLVALGQLLVLLVGGIDLSVGAVMNATLIIIALMNHYDEHLLALSLVLCILFGAAVGMTNGLLVSLRDVPPFAATLGMTACVQGAILVYTKGIPAGNIPASIRPIALAGIGIVPFSLLICLGVAVLLMLVLTKGTYGRMIYAVGRSAEVARRVGVSTTAVRVSAYAICGVFAAMAGIATPLGRYATADEVAEQIVWLLSDHTATMTGSAILLDGGALFLLTVLNVTTLSSLNPFTQLIVQGAVMLVAVSLFQVLKRRSLT